MKKLMILAALGTAALFTACGDDSSSSPSDCCTVSSDETSVTQDWTFNGVTGKTVWKIDGDNVVMTMEPAPENGEATSTLPKGETTIESLKAAAQAQCDAMNNPEAIPAE